MAKPTLASLLKQMKLMENEIDKLKGSLFDMGTRIDQAVTGLNQVSTVVDYHGHPLQLMTGRAIFFESQYKESLTTEKQAQQTPSVQQENKEE